MSLVTMRGNKKPATFDGRGLFDWCTKRRTNKCTKFLSLKMYYTYVTLFEIVKQNLYTQKPEIFFRGKLSPRGCTE